MVEAAGCGELQQLVQEEESEEPLSHGGEATPPSTPARSQHPSKTEAQNSNVSVECLSLTMILQDHQISVCINNNTQVTSSYSV